MTCSTSENVKREVKEEMLSVDNSLVNEGRKESNHFCFVLRQNNRHYFCWSTATICAWRMQHKRPPAILPLFFLCVVQTFSIRRLERLWCSIAQRKQYARPSTFSGSGICLGIPLLYDRLCRGRNKRPWNEGKFSLLDLDTSYNTNTQKPRAHIICHPN